MVLLIGCDTGDQVTLNWQIPPIDTRIVQIDADPTELGRSYPNTTGLVGDPKATVARLVQVVGKSARDGGFAEQAARIVADWRDSMTPLIEKSTAPIAVERLCAEITKALPADGMLVADTGYSGIWTGTMIDLNGAGQTYLRAAGSLGWAFPASLGAQCAAGNRRSSASLAMAGSTTTSPSWSWRAAIEIPAVIVINNNSGFGQNLTGVRRISGNRPGRGEELIRFGPTDFTKVAASFGVRGIRVEEPNRIAPALAEALAANEPIVVDVVTDLEPRAPEAWSPPR